MSAMSCEPGEELAGCYFGVENGFVEGGAEAAGSVDLDPDFDGGC